MTARSVVSHALVLPDQNFYEWLQVARPYLDAFEGVTVVRSPAGNDLNRYRNVTAVQAPLTWMDDSALFHIRRVYPQVVMVDVILAETPDALRPSLQSRIDSDDRYGAADTDPAHIFERFVLEWPTSARPMQILARYNARAEQGELREGLDLYCEADADILCAAAGEVTAVGGASNSYGFRSHLQVESVVEEERYVTTYEGIKLPRVKAGDRVETWQVLAKGVDERLRLILQNPPDRRRQLRPDQQCHQSARSHIHPGTGFAAAGGQSARADRAQLARPHQRQRTQLASSGAAGASWSRHGKAGCERRLDQDAFGRRAGGLCGGLVSAGDIQERGPVRHPQRSIRSGSISMPSIPWAGPIPIVWAGWAGCVSATTSLTSPAPRILPPPSAAICR